VLSKWYYVPSIWKNSKKSSLSLSLSLCLPLISLLFQSDLRKEETFWRMFTTFEMKKWIFRIPLKKVWGRVRNEEEDASRRVGEKGNEKKKVVKFWFKN